MKSGFHVVLDTNVIVSTMLNVRSVPGTIVGFCLDGLLTPVFNEEIYLEYRNVLSRPKFGFNSSVVDSFLTGLRYRASIIEATPLSLKLSDKDDKKFYEVLVADRQLSRTYLVTGNLRHFPREPFIVSPRQMLDIIQE